MPTSDYPMQLTTGRVLEQWHTGTMTERIPELRDAAGSALIEINEQDAWTHKIQEGDTVELKSRYGTMQGKARLSRSPRPGVVFASFYDAKLLINRVVADNVDPISKQPEYKITAVALSRVGA
jgi:nitrate reductase NapA